jgi:hypothetical protein
MPSYIPVTAEREVDGNNQTKQLLATCECQAILSIIAGLKRIPSSSVLLVSIPMIFRPSRRDGLVVRWRLAAAECDNILALDQRQLTHEALSSWNYADI